MHSHRKASVSNLDNAGLKYVASADFVRATFAATDVERCRSATTHSGDSEAAFQYITIGSTGTSETVMCEYTQG